MMFCTTCGAQNADGAKFCSKCGAPLRSVAPDTVPAPGTETTLLTEDDGSQAPHPKTTFLPVTESTRPAPQEARPAAAQPAAGSPVVPPWQPAGSPQPSAPAADSWQQAPGDAFPQGAPQSVSATPSAPSTGPATPPPTPPEQPPASWPAGGPEQPPVFEQPGKKRTGLIAGIVIGVIVIAVIAVAALFMAGVISLPFGSSDGGASVSAEDASAAEDALTVPAYGTADFYEGKTVEEIANDLLDEGFSEPTVYAYDTGGCDMMFGGTIEDVPSNADGHDMFVDVYLDLNENVDPATIETVEDIPDSATIGYVTVSYDTNADPKDYVTEASSLVDALGLKNAEYGTATTEDMLGEAADAFGFDAEDGWVNDASDLDFELDELSVSGAGTFFGESGRWYISITDYGDGASVFYMFSVD